MLFKIHTKNLFFIFLLLHFSTLGCLVRNFIESVKVVNVSSGEQTVIDSNRFVLKDSVDVLVDKSVHIWADYVEIDKKKQLLYAEKRGLGAVIIETDTYLFFVDKFFLNLDDKTGYVENARIQLAEGYIFAKKAEKLVDGSWKMRDVSFTPCDKDCPHWSISANRARLHKNYIIKVSGVLFKARNIPFFCVPYLVLPLQNSSASGFLLPRVSYDEDLGVGLRQEFYWSIAKKCDCTLGFDWRDKKGIAFIGEFRWARAPESFTTFEGQYAIEKNAFVKKKNKIVLSKDKIYWIEGKDFRPLWKVLGTRVKSLSRLDFGQNKKIGYEFFEDLSDLDDTFYNSWILRFVENHFIFNAFFDGRKTIRSKFSEIDTFEKKLLHLDLKNDLELDTGWEESSCKIKKEVEDKVTVFYLPHFEFNGIYKRLKNLFSYRNDIFFDCVLSREKKEERIYFGTNVLDGNGATYLTKANSFRFLYDSNFQVDLNFGKSNALFFLKPNLQFRSNLLNKYQTAKKNVFETHIFSDGSLRGVLRGGAKWFLPEVRFESYDGSNYHLIQPSFSWDFLPKFKQDHWYHSDRWDRLYPENRLLFQITNSWFVDNAILDLNISQGYDFYRSSDRFQLYRNPRQKHLLPFDVELFLTCDILDFFIRQKYDWKGLKLFESEIGVSFSVGDFRFDCISFYQDNIFQQACELFSDLPHIMMLSVALPLQKRAIVHYEGQLYSEKVSKIFPFQNPKALIHALRFEYKGHCWGISMGIEEKNYKQYGCWKNEKAFTLFFRLDSLGSFAKKFKQPQPISRF